MEKLNSVLKTATALADIARRTQTYRFPAPTALMFYMHADAGDVRIKRHDSREIVVTAMLQAPFGWRVAAEQDEAGVYFVALRRKLAASVADAAFFVTVPDDAHTILRLDGANLTLENLHVTLSIPPGAEMPPLLPPPPWLYKT